MVIKAFLIGILLFTGFRVLVFILKRIGFTKGLKHHLDYMLSIFELVIWFAFLTWVIKLVYESKDHYVLVFAGIVLALLIVPAFILLRDFVFGVFLKAQKKVVEGTIIELEDIKGEIVKAGEFFLNIEDKLGNIKSIGYFKVSSKVISIAGENQHLERLVLDFHFPMPNKVNETIEKLNYHLLNTPWVAASKLPIVEGISNDADRTLVRMAVFVIHKSYRENILEMVNQNLGLSE